MTREEAYKAMQEGHKIAHQYFGGDEYYEIIYGQIRTEDNVNHTGIFWAENDGNWRKDGWHIKE